MIENDHSKKVSDNKKIIIGNVFLELDVYIYI